MVKVIFLLCIYYDNFFKEKKNLIKEKDCQSWQFGFSAKYYDMVTGPVISLKPGRTDLEGSRKKLCLEAQNNFRDQKRTEARLLRLCQEHLRIMLNHPDGAGLVSSSISRHILPHPSLHRMNVYKKGSQDS